MRQRWFRAGFLAFFVLIFLFLRPVLKEWESDKSSRIILRFSLPLPASVVKKNLLTPEEIQIESIYVSGFFCEWNPTNELYRMQPDGKQWKVKVPFKPGENEYKFVVWLKDYPEAIWVNDVHAVKQVSDGYGGYNSVYVIHDMAPFAIFIRLFLYGIILILALTLALEPLISFIAIAKMSLKFKIILSVELLVLLSGILIIVSQNRQQRSLLRNFLIEEVNVIHLGFIGRGGDVEHLGSLENRAKIEKSWDRSFNYAMSRTDFGVRFHRQLTLLDLVVFDTNWQVIAYSGRFEKAGVDDTKLAHTSYPDLKMLYREAYFGKLIQKIQKQKFQADFQFGKMTRNLFQFYSPNYRRYLHYLPGNVFLTPIYFDDKIVGYYGGVISSEFWGNFFRKQMLFQLFLLFIGILMIGIIFNHFGNLLIGHLGELVDWSDKIAEHKFNETRNIRTGDEIEHLAKNFDRMRLKLLESFETIQHLYYFKTRFYSSLSHELRTPLNSILSTVESLRYGAFAKNEEIGQDLKNLSERDYSALPRLSQIQKQISVLISLSEEEYQLKKVGFLQLAQMLKGNDSKALDLTRSILRNIDLEETEVSEAYRVIRDSARHLLEIIEMMLNLARVNELDFKLEKHPLKLKSFVDRLIHEVSITEEYQNKKERVQLFVEFEEGIEMELALHELWNRKVLMSLLMNAVQHTDQGVVILSVERNRDLLLFSVTDTGSGISSEQQKLIFQEIQTEEEKSSNGSGLSLALAKQLIEMQGGEIGFTSVVNKGSKFWFSLSVDKWKSDV